MIDYKIKKLDNTYIIETSEVCKTIEDYLNTIHYSKCIKEYIHKDLKFRTCFTTYKLAIYFKAEYKTEDATVVEKMEQYLKLINRLYRIYDKT